MLDNLSGLIAKAKEGDKRTIAVAAAEDEFVLKAVQDAVVAEVMIPLLIGDKGEIEKIARRLDFDLSRVDILDNREGAAASARIAVSKVKIGEADGIMKGYISTGDLLRAVLDKDVGLRTGRLLSHVALFQSPYYHKLLCVTDAAMNIAPSLDEKVQIIQNAVLVCRNVEIETPKVAVAAAVETVNQKMEATLHAPALKAMNREGILTGCVVDGPFAIDIAVSRESALHKGIDSPVAGDCDVILAPDIEAGNMLYKALNFLGGAVSAAVIVGALVPVVLTSRSDNERSKLYSIALAACMGKG
ncbi:MAG: bifunctional enoyl-CoA hydratase/phosphate acetyltransferase [Bacteroidota bacterium]|jgi:phosphate butyryltransferase|nr:bifunctional enoyl-CoA hydratase/phosphate acetyltransferase [Bacteroidota bacterium]